MDENLKNDEIEDIKYIEQIECLGNYANCRHGNRNYNCI